MKEGEIMVKRECILNTCHDELFYHLIIPKVENQNDKTSIKLVGTEKLFSAQEIFMLMIILDHYKKTDALGVPLTFKFIQTSYRNRRFTKLRCKFIFKLFKKSEIICRKRIK